MESVKDNSIFGNRFKRTLLSVSLILIALLIALSIYSAFIGAEKAQALFNSVPLAIYWILFLVLLIGALLTFRSRRSISFVANTLWMCPHFNWFDAGF